MEGEDLKKKVDESYKATVEKDKTGDGAGLINAPEATFGLFVSGLMMEALIALGELEHPATRKREVNLPHAKYVIDTLDMIKHKTVNNLSAEERESIDAVLYELRMRYVAKSPKI